MKRYETTYDDGDYPLKESPDGEWVRYEDVVKLVLSIFKQGVKIHNITLYGEQDAEYFKQYFKQYGDIDGLINSLSGD